MKKFLIVLAVIAILLTIIYQALSYYAFEWQREDCINKYSNDTLMSQFVDVNTICNCVSDESKKYGLIKTFLDDENSDSRKAFNQKLEDKCITPNINMSKLANEVINEAVKEESK